QLKYHDHAYIREFFRLSPRQSWCATNFEQLILQEKEKLHKKNIFTNKSFTTYKPKPGVLYYDCWYTFELNLIKPSVVIPMKVASRKWIFHTPDCITINNSRICGCP
ncbi:Hypothetical predicted protein, partial [Paramuricea clavata]